MSEDDQRHEEEPEEPLAGGDGAGPEEGDSSHQAEAMLGLGGSSYLWSRHEVGVQFFERWSRQLDKRHWIILARLSVTCQ